MLGAAVTSEMGGRREHRKLLCARIAYPTPAVRSISPLDPS